MAENEIDIAIKAFEENRVRTNQQTDAYNYNLSVGLLALARAVKETQERIEATNAKIIRIEGQMRSLYG